MDARTRHELKQNELAEALARLRNLADPRIKYTLIGLAAVAVVVVGIYAWRYNQQRLAEQNWQTMTELAAALGSREQATVEQAQTRLRDLIAKTSDPSLAGHARLQLARWWIERALTRPELRPSGFEEAVKLLTEIIAMPNTPVTLEAAATYALASAYESLREFDQAQTLYTRLANEPRFAGCPFRVRAAERLESLDEIRVAVVFAPGAPPGIDAAGGTSIPTPLLVPAEPSHPEQPGPAEPGQLPSGEPDSAPPESESGSADPP